MQLQIARRLITVGARLRWVAIGAAVLLGNANADCEKPFNIARRLITVGARLRWVAIGAAGLLGNATADC